MNWSQMKIIVCGSQNFSNESLLVKTLREYTHQHKVSTIVLGQESGTETMAAEWAMKNNIRLSIVPTNRNISGQEAFIERNKRIVATHKDAMAVLHFVGCEISEDLCNRSLANNIAIDDVVISSSSVG